MARMDFTVKDVYDVTVLIVAENFATRHGERSPIQAWVEQAQRMIAETQGGREGPTHLRRVVQEAGTLAVEILKQMEDAGWVRSDTAAKSIRYIDSLPTRR